MDWLVRASFQRRLKMMSIKARQKRSTINTIFLALDAAIAA